nr:MAG TPA: hypothetical protein [Caudoviricetes sp.]
MYYISKQLPNFVRVFYYTVFDFNACRALP